ncbi:DUF4232 domain-containing protein [Actinoplanes sp. TRM 88003]|uniref:DUF4232 domain-containing protein n=1 Tax=Paractinoplanes aksuensis TaxID=2939490 RepID=A0ABT1E049_9ACTN|nr:DUF4232 domain-containing protein [Actinoplanes aksuensis]MCO8275545.1 DUF4232 domain-containing protein [Actinoplanes aksuensis]
MAQTIKRAAGAVAVVTGIVMMQACAVGEQAPIAPASERPALTASKPTPSPPATSSAAAARACGNDDMSVVVTLQPDQADGQARGLVTLANRSKFTCRVQGRIAISLVNPAGEVVDVPTRNVDQPGPSVPALLRPGAAAFEGIKWRPCDKGSDSCGVGNTLRFNLQAGTDGPAATLSGFPPSAASAITMASLQVGTLQPARQGVVDW